MTNSTKLMPQDIWCAYERGQDYKRSIGLFDTVRRNENFFCGKQWEGLRVKSLDPLIFNVLRRCVNLFISLLVSDDVAVEVKPFTGGETTEKVLSAAMQEAIERSKVKTLGRGLLKNACVDGDGAYYIHFDPAAKAGQAVSGELVVETIDNTNLYFGNPACNEVQRQPYLIIAMRRALADVRAEARKNGMSEREAEAILPDEGESEFGALAQNRVTVLLFMQRTEQGIRFYKTTRFGVVMPEKILPYRLYPVAYMSWVPVKNSYHGVSPVTEAIPNQIAINKLYSMYVQCVKNTAFPKIVYDMTRFPNGWSNDVGTAIGMRGNPNEALASAFRAPDISVHVMNVLSRMMKDTMELMGASDAILGNVSPSNTSAIIAVQKATAAPMELTRMEFYRFVEDWVRIFLDQMAVHYGKRSYMISDENGLETKVSYDFAALSAADVRLNVEVGASSYWSETMQTVTNDHLFERGIISDPVIYLQNIPASQVRGKTMLMRSLRQRQAKENQDGENNRNA